MLKKKLLALTVLLGISFSVFWIFLYATSSGHTAFYYHSKKSNGNYGSQANNIQERIRNWKRCSKHVPDKYKKRRLPDVIGIGTKKCGTDAIISFLSFHPLVKTPKDVEAFFFNRKYHLGLELYKNLMPDVAKHEIIMEKTPVYFNSPPLDIPQKIKKSLPNVKLILVICEPVSRSFSDYTHERARYKISAKNDDVADYSTFDSFLDAYLDKINETLRGTDDDILKHQMSIFYKDPASTLLTTGLYSLYLPRWTRLFDSKKLLILNGESLLNDPGKQFEKIQDFLEIPKLLLAEDFVRNPLNGLFCIRPWWNDYDFSAEKTNATGWTKNLKCLTDTKGRTRHSNGVIQTSEERLKKLSEFYRPFNEKLFSMTGIDFRVNKTFFK